MKKKLTSRDIQAAETQQRIMDVAFDLFAKKKYDEVSMVEIAEAAGVSTGSLYYHFASKYDLAMKFCEKAEDALIAKNFPKNYIGSIHAAECLLDFFTKLYSKAIMTVGVDIASVLYNPANRSVILNIRYYDTLEEIISVGIAKGELKTDKTPLELSNFLTTVARGVSIDWCLHNGEYDLQNSLHDYMCILIPPFIGDGYQLKN